MSMTIQEAIKRIDQHMSVHHIGEPPHIHIMEALQMAIAALREKAERENPKPLTIEKLRQMDGEPVYLVFLSLNETGWEIFVEHDDYGFETDAGSWYYAKTYGKKWLAYRHKPKEGI